MCSRDTRQMATVCSLVVNGYRRSRRTQTNRVNFTTSVTMATEGRSKCLNQPYLSLCNAQKCRPGFHIVSNTRTPSARRASPQDCRALRESGTPYFFFFSRRDFGHLGTPRISLQQQARKEGHGGRTHTRTYSLLRSGPWLMYISLVACAVAPSRVCRGRVVTGKIFTPRGL